MWQRLKRFCLLKMTKLLLTTPSFNKEHESTKNTELLEKISQKVLGYLLRIQPETINIHAQRSNIPQIKQSIGTRNPEKVGIFYSVNDLPKLITDIVVNIKDEPEKGLDYAWLRSTETDQDRIVINLPDGSILTLIK